MTQETRTPLDDAHAAMEAAPDSETARLRFYERLADGELYMLLEAEPEGRNITPRVFPLEDGPVVLLFDLEDRLSDFAAGAVPYAALSGRAVAELLAGQQIGLGVNLGHPSAIILPYQSVDWLAETLGHRPSETQDHPEQLSAPRGLPESLLTGLDEKWTWPFSAPRTRSPRGWHRPGCALTCRSRNRSNRASRPLPAAIHHAPPSCAEIKQARSQSRQTARPAAADG